MGSTLDASSWKEYEQRLMLLQTDLATGSPLGQVIKGVRELLSGYAVSCPDEMTDIEDSYNLMRDFMFRGYKDGSRAGLYAKLSRRLNRLLLNMSLDVRLRFDPPVAYLSKLPNVYDFDVDTLRSQLESFVSDIAMLSLETADDNSERHRALYKQRQTNVSRAFVSIIKSGQWSRGLEQDVCSLLLSPTIDTNDAQLLCTAIMLSSLLSSDARKVSTLMHIYQRAADERLRQRAFVGWVLAADGCDMTFAEDVKALVSELLEDSKVRAELMELQMQMIYCMSADRDTETIRKDVMPTIIRNQNIEITPQGIREKEEDPMNDILHGDDTDRRMEEMEKSIRKMMDMQKQGVDIYFGGFSKMKRFGFFYNLSNWFAPFYLQHSDLQHISREVMESPFIKALCVNGPFCDSDKYSFVLGMSKVYEQLPDNVKEMVTSGAAMQMERSSGGDASSPAYIRRLYLQDLYRFFRVSDSRKAFRNPFEGVGGHLLLDAAVFVPRLHDEAMRTVRFLLKRHQPAEARLMLDTYYDESQVSDLCLKAHLLVQGRDYANAEQLYAKAYALASDDEQVLKGYALSSLHCRHYPMASKLYGRLLQLYPDHATYKLRCAVALIHDNREEEGVKMLYEMYYRSADNLDVRRALAWGLLCQQRAEQAAKLYEGLLAEGEPADSLNAGYCAWFSGDYERARMLFEEYLSKAGADAPSLEVRFAEDAQIFQKYGISEVDRNIMAGL